jgi:mono/diheme cytochrome c family protein
LTPSGKFTAGPPQHDRDAVLTLSGAGLRAQDSPGGETSFAISSDGAKVYEEICQACHMADARGGGGAGATIPSLADNPRLADKDYAISILVRGKGGMPWFTDMLTEEQIAAVLNHVRNRFNGYPDPVTAEEVRRITAKSRTASSE